MAAGTDGEETFEEGCGKTSELAVQAVYKGTGAKGGWNGGEGPSWNVQKFLNSGKGDKGANRAGKGQWSKTGGKKGGKGQEKGGQGDTRVCGSCGKTGHTAANCTKGSWDRSLNAVGADEGDIREEVHEDEDELNPWCLLEESENEQRREVTRKKSKLKMRKHFPWFIAECRKQFLRVSKNVVEVKDKWVNIRAKMDMDPSFQIRGHQL